jgi:hypothetical protein
MPEHERTASAMISVATVHAVVDLASRLPADFRALAIAEAHRMMVAHFGDYDARYGIAAR